VPKLKPTCPCFAAVRISNTSDCEVRTISNFETVVTSQSLAYIIHRKTT